MDRFQELTSWLQCTLVVIMSLTLTPLESLAQSVCDPPSPGEFLLLIVTETPEQQALVRQTLPGDIESSICRYVNDTVVRVAGFADAQIADDWARYVQDLIQLPSFVVEAGSVTPLAPGGGMVVSPSPSGSPANPHLLGPGYAVLVDYFNRPEVASQIQQSLGHSISLVSYGQRPYLLAIHTTDQNAATATMQTLNQQGFWALLVDSRRVIRLGQAVNP